MISDPGARPFGNQGPPRIAAPKKAARSAGSKAAAKSTTSKPSRAQDDSEEETDAKGEDKAEPKRKKAKTDPRVAAKLAKLEVEKDVILTSDKWCERVKNLNIEATQSIELAKSYPQTKGFPG